MNIHPVQTVNDFVQRDESDSGSGSSQWPVALRNLLLLAILTISTSGCPRVPTRPGEFLPIVELQINNSPEQTDDYVTPSAVTPSRIRIFNESSINLDVPVRLENMDTTYGGQVRFGISGTPSQFSLDLTLPEDGAWVDFLITGLASGLSVRDKDAVIQVIESRVDGVVLGRKALMVPAGFAALGGAPRIELRLGSVATIDDYLTWAPTVANVRLVNAPSFTSDIPIRLSNMTPTSGGRILFDTESSLSPPTVTATGYCGFLEIPCTGLTLNGSGFA